MKFNQKFKEPIVDINVEQAEALTAQPIGVSEATFTREEDQEKVDTALALRTAEKFVSRVAEGEAPWKAAQAIGTTLKKLEKSADMKAAIAALLEVGRIEEAVRKQMVEAGLNKLFMRTVDSDDPKHMKVALEAAKLIGQQTGQNPSDVQVTVDLGELGSVLDKGVSLPGLEEK